MAFKIQIGLASLRSILFCPRTVAHIYIHSHGKTIAEETVSDMLLLSTPQNPDPEWFRRPARCSATRIIADGADDDSVLRSEVKADGYRSVYRATAEIPPITPPAAA